MPGHVASGGKRVAFFPGSTIGNLDPEQAESFLSRAASILGGGGLFLIGVDLIKDAELLEAAYNDAHGVTAEFNLNLLHRLNREAGASFDPRLFRHEARWNERHHRMEMHLVSTCEQIVQVAGEPIDFRKGESIHTESSYKYEPSSFEELARRSGFAKVRLWSDLRGFFGVYLLRAEEARAEASDLLVA
jgi:dimethylhistidine N-methyltransferase